MPKDTKTLGNNKARACESLGFVHKKRLCQRFDTTSFYISEYRFYAKMNFSINKAASIYMVMLISLCLPQNSFTNT